MSDIFSALWNAIITVFDKGWSVFSEYWDAGWNSFTEFINKFLGGLDVYIMDWLNEWFPQITIPADVFKVFNEITIGVGYIIPVKALLPIPLFMISFYVLKLVFSIYQLIAGTIIQRTKLKL